MKDILNECRRAALSTLILALTCCGLYPLLVFGIGQAAFPDKANGSLIVDEQGTVRGSTLLGQHFAATHYLHPRPSAAGSGYDAASSGGSNLGPTSQKLRDAIRDRIATYRTENGLAPETPVPADAVTASASGLDPHISPRNARLQAPRIAHSRGLDATAVLTLIAACTDSPTFSILGEPGVNVLKLNLALDGLEAGAR